MLTNNRVFAAIILAMVLGPLATAATQQTPDIYIDSQTRPAAHYQNESVPVSESMARQVLRSFDVSHWTGALPGQPISLTDAMATTTIESRPEMIRAYWQTFEKWAAHVAAQTETSQLADLQQPSSAIERDLLGTAISLAKSRILESEIDLGMAQQRLRQFAATIGPDIMPLASDLPLVAEYETNYATLAARAPFNSRLSQINSSLPKYFEVIQARADASAKCQTAARQAIQACNQNQLALGTALEAIRMCRESQQEFVRAVSRYNLDIAEYALTVAPFGQPADQVVSMLIKRPDTGPTNNSPVARSAALEPQQQSARSGEPPTNLTNALRGPLTPSTRNRNEESRLVPQAETGVELNSALRAIPQTKIGSLSPAEPKNTNATSSIFGDPQFASQPPTNPPLNNPPTLQNNGGSFSFDKR